MTAVTAGAAGEGRPWGLWRRQVGGIVRLELRKVLLSRMALIGWGLAALPVLLMVARVLVVVLGFDVLAEGERAIGDTAYAEVYQTLMLRLCVFFGCLAIFVNLVRGEVYARTLHYYLLAPVRREVLVFGKYVGGLAGAALVFGGATLATRLVMLGGGPGWGETAVRTVMAGPWLGHTLAYVGVTLAACAGYGAVFLVVGLLRVNPIIPAVVVFAWEAVNPFLPAALQPMSVVHALLALCPVPVSLGPIAILGQPPSGPVAALELALVTALLVALAMRQARGLEALYGED